MSQDFEEFFGENVRWEADGTDTAVPMQPPSPPRSRRDMRRQRERRKRRKMLTITAIVLVVALVFVGGYFGYRKLIQWRDANNSSETVIKDYPGPGEGEVQFTVEQGQDATTIAENLYAADIIKSPEAFTSVVMSNNSVLYPGTFSLLKHMKAADVVAILSDQTQASGFLEVRSGERVSDVIAAAVELSGLAQSDFDAIINGGGSDILPAEANGDFEGWFEPGSYDVQNKTAEEIISAMVESRIAKLDSLGVPTGEERERILIMASIAESEVNSPEYYGKVTRVILNRLEQGITLGMDTTVAYGLGITADELTDAMLQDDSNPYNTRLHTGLTPGPISNPGDNAIKAALNPEQGDWLYFVTTNLQTGETKFTTGTMDEQNAQFEQYVNEYKTTNENAN